MAAALARAKPPAPLAAPATPQALTDLSDAFSDFSDRLDDFIKASGDPFTPAMIQLRNMDTHIAADAAIAARLAVEAMAPEVGAALDDLGAQIARAKGTLDDIQNVKTALSIVAAVLSTASALASGSPLASAESVIALAQVVSSALKASGGPGG